MCRCNFSSLYSEKENLYHSPASKFLHQKRHYSVISSAISSVISSVIFYQFYVYGNVELFLHLFECVVVLFQYCVNVKNTRASSFYRCFSILRSRKCGISLQTFLHLYPGEKTGLMIFLIPVVRDIAANCTCQSRSEFDWYNRYLYNY